MGPKAMKAMKAMKAAKAMKAMKAMKKAMKVRKVATGKLAKSQVLKGRREKTVGGLTAKDLMKNKAGKVVSKNASNRGKKNAWALATKAARKALGIKGFCAVGGKSAQAKALYAKAKAILASETRQQLVHANESSIQ